VHLLHYPWYLFHLHLTARLLQLPLCSLKSRRFDTRHK
jgi:hypothetical protein